MKKIFKIGAVTLLFLIICITTANAAGIVINLEDYAQSNTVNDNLQNIVSDEETNISEDVNDDSPRVTSTTTSDDDEFLTVENILSIIIIVIGVLLIFLAIAILIRLK